MQNGHQPREPHPAKNVSFSTSFQAVETFLGRISYPTMTLITPKSIIHHPIRSNVISITAVFVKLLERQCSPLDLDLDSARIWLENIAIAQYRIHCVVYTSSFRASRGWKFQKGKNYKQKKEFAYRMCARRRTSAMPKPSFLCAPAFSRSMVVM